MLKKIYSDFLLTFKKENNLEEKLFTIIGLVGVFASLLNGFIYIALPKHLSTGIICFVAAILSLLLIIFVQQSGKYLLAYYVTVFGVFTGLFTVLFFLQGANSGYLLIMGLLFTCMLLHGKHLLIAWPLQMIWYLLVFIYTYYHPELVHDTSSPDKNFLSLIIGCLGCGTIICLSMRLYVNAFRKANKAAEKAAMDALEAGKAKDRFLANMSHEIRTPINTILGMNEMIARESKNAKILPYTEDISSSSYELLGIIDDILDYSRIGAGKELLRESVYSTKNLIHKWEYTGSNLAAKKNLVFTTNVDSRLPEFLYGDFEKINRIILNLISNAVKYTDFGSIKLDIKVDAINQSNLSFKIMVKDTGHGIRKEDLGILFNSFERLDMERNRKIKGTGLGLAISKELADLMNATLTCESEYEKGSLFTLSISQQLRDESEYTEQTGNTIVLDKIIKAPGAHILVVDDNENNRNIISLLLKRSEIKIDMAESGIEALSRYKTNHYDAVLMDYRMSGMDGIETLERIRMLDEDSDESKRTPVVVITADIIEGTKEKLLAAGFDAFLAKPVNEAALSSTLAKFLPKELVSEVGVEETAYETMPDSKKEPVKDINILVVDDDPSMRRLSGTILKNAGYNVNSADSGERCIEMLEALKSSNESPNLILLDINLSGMNGYETYEKIRTIKDYSYTPIIFMTSESSIETEVMCMELGASDFIMKPFVADIMLARIANQVIKAESLKKEMSNALANSNYDPNKLAAMEQTLSSSEFLIAKMIADGYSNREIAEKTNYSYAYVKKLGSIIFDKLQIEKRGDLRAFFK